MAKHEVIIQENKGATKEAAPFTPLYVKKDDFNYDSIVAQVAKEAGITETIARTILDNAFEEFIAMEKEGAVRIHVDGMTIALAIKESLPSADAAFDPATNSMTVNIYLDDDVRYALAGVTPKIVTDETSSKVRITHIADEATPMPYDVIHGQYVFEVQGFNLSMSDAGAGASLIGANGIANPCTLVEAVSLQKARFKSATLLEGGDYKFVVKSRGGDAEGPLQTPFRRVKYLKVTPPPVDHATMTNLRTSELDEANELSIADSVTLTFDKDDQQRMAGKLVVNGVEQQQPLTPTGTTIQAMWTWDREELIGQQVTFAFKYTDGTVTTLITKTIRAERT